MQILSLQNLQMANVNSYPKEEGEGGGNKDMKERKKNKNIAQFN